jgi:hypothetical protein
MRLARLPIRILAAAFGIFVGSGHAAFAQGPDTAAPIGPMVQGRDVETFTETRPNTDLIVSGLFTLGVPYVASVVAAAESSRQGDQYLYIPVAGPWIDFAARGSCPATLSCGNESFYKVLLALNGVIQGVGAAEVVAGFLFPVSHSVTISRTPSIRIAPQVGRTGYGLTAYGTF